MIAAWFLLPLLLTALALGWGLLVELACGRRLPRSLLPGVGFSAIAVVGSATTAADSTAELTTPLVVGGAMLGLALGARQMLRATFEPWLLAACAGVFIAYAMPIVLSGEATFAGYIKLDDTATWLALTDRVMEHGRSLEGLAPSSYEATLAFNLGDWYPVGAFLPLGICTEIMGEDPAWLIQPLMAWLAVLLALPIARLASAAGPPRVRAGIAFVAAQPALLVGYYLWGGIKEVAAAALIANAAALGAAAIVEPPTLRSMLPLATVCGALLAILTIGGAVWIAPIVVGVGALAVVRHGFAVVRRPLVTATVAIGLLSVLILIDGTLVPSTSSPLLSETDLGNLLSPLNPLQAFGIWAAGDFRTEPDLPGLTYVAVTIAIAAAAYGICSTWRRDSGLLLFASALIGAAALILSGSPWIDGKALATASPILVLLALVGCVGLLRIGRKVEGGIALAVIVGGVVFSNMLAFSEVNLGPRDQLAELEDIGGTISGEGPTLMTEFQPYGVRHFLRDGDPESVSELRRRAIPLRTGETVLKGLSADLDELDPGGISVFRTIVLRRSPSQSRPPAPYELVYSGDYYEVWQRPSASEVSVLAHLPLGQGGLFSPTNSRTRRTSVPSCAEVVDLGRLASNRGGTLVAASGDQPLDVNLAGAETPEDWVRPSAPGTIFPTGTGSLTAEFEVEREGRYGIWLGGSARGRLAARVDGTETGSVRHRLNNGGEFIELGEAHLGPGVHRIDIDYASRWLRPGEAGDDFPLGPLMIGASSGESNGRLTSVSASRARSLCGQAWDWIEAVSGGPATSRAP